MKQDEFIKELKSLEAFFEKELTIEQMRDWYEETKNFSIERFRQAIREAKRSCKFLPKLSEFLDFLELTRDPSQEIGRYEGVECSRCKGRGFIIYIKKIANGNKTLEYEHVARCNCKNGEMFHYDGGTMSNPRDRSKFYIPSMEEVGLYETSNSTR